MTESCIIRTRFAGKIEINAPAVGKCFGTAFEETKDVQGRTKNQANAVRQADRCINKV